MALSQIESWLLDPEGVAPSVCRKRSRTELRHRLRLLLAPSQDVEALRKACLATKLRLASGGGVCSNAKPSEARDGEEEGVEAPSISRVSGRYVKTPSKFKEEATEPLPRPRLPTAHKSPLPHKLQPPPRSQQPALPGKVALAKPPLASRRHSLGSPRAKSPRSNLAEAEHATLEPRVGAAYQPTIHTDPDPGSCVERGDVLVWSACACSLTEAELDAYMEDAVTLCGGSPQNPPTQASAQEVFPAEMALHALYASRYDVTAARALIEESTRTRNHNDWTKVEERHCRSAMGKVGKDSSSYRMGKEASHVREASSCGLIRKIQESVKTKSLDAVTRFFYVELGMRKKAKRERKRELELLAHERSGYRAGSTTPPY